MNSHSLMQENIWRVSFRYIALDILSMLGISTYVLADTYFIANGVGADGLVALNLVLPLWTVIPAVGLMCGVGGATLFSIAQGAGRPQDARPLYTRSLVMAVVLGGIYAVLLIAFAPAIVVLMGGTGHLVGLASTYIRTVGSFTCAFIANHVTAAFVRNDGHPRLAMVSMVLGNLANVALDYIFIYPMKMGMFGAALATGISPVVSLLVLAPHFARGKSRFTLARTPFLPKEQLRILSLGVPSFVTELSTGLVILLFNKRLLALSGNLSVAAYGIIANLTLVCLSIFTGTGQGVQPVVSLHWGAGSRSQSRKALFCALGSALVLGFGFFLACRFSPEPIAALFNGENDPLLADLTCRGLTQYGFAYLFMGLNTVLAAYFAAVSRPTPSLIISSLRGFGAVIPCLFLLSALWGIDGVWRTVPAAELLTLAVALVFLLGERRSSPKS